MLLHVYVIIIRLLFVNLMSQQPNNYTNLITFHLLSNLLTAARATNSIILNFSTANYFLQTDNDHYLITPIASVSIVDGDFIVSNDGSSQRSANVSNTIIKLIIIMQIVSPIKPLSKIIDGQ